MDIKTILNRQYKQRGFVYEKISLSQDASALLVRLVPRKNGRPRCSQCHKPGPIHDTLPARRFAFIPLWGLLVWFIYRMRRVNCSHCNRITIEEVPWSLGGKQRLTTAYACFLAQWCEKLDWQWVAKRYRISWGLVASAVEWVVEWGLERRSLDNVRAIGVDEIQYKDGHRYLTMVYQLDQGSRRLLWIGKERTKEIFHQFFDMMGEERSRSITHVCSDMWQAYITVIKERAGTAVHILDRFHIVQKLNKKIDAIRAREVKELKDAGEEPYLTKSKWIFLHKRKNLSRKKKVRARLAELLARNLKVVKAYLLKEDFDHFWSYTTAAGAERFLDKWCKKVMRYRSLPEMKDFVKMMRRHKPLILNYFEAKKTLSNSITEGLNNKVKVTIRKSYGYKSDKIREIALFHAVGKLSRPELTHKFF